MKHWRDPRHKAFLGEMTMVYNDVFPRNVVRILEAVRQTWRSAQWPRGTTLKLAPLRSRIAAKKTDHAIRRWLYEEAPLPQMAGTQYCMQLLIVRIWDLPPDDPEFCRLRLKIGRDYRIRDACLAGLDLCETS